jgi:hypothetical protein
MCFIKQKHSERSVELAIVEINMGQSAVEECVLTQAKKG